jgi:hypothetical protein
LEARNLDERIRFGHEAMKSLAVALVAERRIDFFFANAIHE